MTEYPIGPPPPRIDKSDHCIGRCGKTLLKGHYYCRQCMPEGWEPKAPDLAHVRSILLTKGTAAPKSRPTMKKPRSDKAKREQEAYMQAKREEKK